MKYYIIIKRKNSKKIVGVIPGKEGVSKERLRIKVRKNLSKRYSFRILTKNQTKTILAKGVARNIPKQKSRPKKRASFIKRKHVIRKIIRRGR